ncbi:salivary glue protein Sgs-3-like [Homarus americanus]|uniref:salivary glue protein Sgs-3-like n=1 Tax=Homarus americanus TaxID=6706 RepID=UPI001C43CBFD|nr:salivary glue protein Sgs-3-like [Homarus americanus]
MKLLMLLLVCVGVALAGVVQPVANSPPQSRGDFGASVTSFVNKFTTPCTTTVTEYTTIEAVETVLATCAIYLDEVPCGRLGDVSGTTSSAPATTVVTTAPTTTIITPTTTIVTVTTTTIVPTTNPPLSSSLSPTTHTETGDVDEETEAETEDASNQTETPEPEQDNLLLPDVPESRELLMPRSFFSCSTVTHTYSMNSISAITTFVSTIIATSGCDAPTLSYAPCLGPTAIYSMP